MAIRRLTRVDSRSVEQPINLEADDDVFNYPWLYAAETGHWELTPQQIAKFREYLLRGGFFMCDDFHGDDEWQVFMETMRKVFPDRQVVDLDDKEAIFHTVFDLDDRYQVPGAQFMRSSSVCEKCAVWRRDLPTGAEFTTITAASWSPSAITWIWAIPGKTPTIPAYPQKFSALGIRIGVNYIVYAMTH